MAGNYPDAPSWRLPIDKDGTQLFKIVSNSPVQEPGTSLTAMNNEGSGFNIGMSQGQTTTLAFLFPEKRDIDGYWLSYPVMGGAWQVSTDTTNGVDGTWTTVAATWDNTTAPKPNYRTKIQSSTILGIRGMKITTGAWGLGGGGGPFWLHLYGEPSPGENPNRLAIWHPTLDQRVPPAYFDWGNVPRNSSADLPFRVKNLSSVLTAHSIRVAMEVLTDSNPSMPGMHSLSTDGNTFLAQVNVGDLAPGAISGVTTLRRIIPSNAQLSLWSMRLFAEANSWS